VVSRGKRRWAFVVKQSVAILFATAGLAAVSPVPAHALYQYNQSFETLDIGWSWGGVGQGTGEWRMDDCGVARTGCGSVLMTQGPTGYGTLFTTVRLSALDYGWCTIGYYARLWNSTGRATARVEVINTSGYYVGLTDKTLTNSSWTWVGTGFYQFAARDVTIRITLPGSAATSRVGIGVDDLSVYCRVLVQGRG